MERRPTIRDFRDLEVWQTAMRLFDTITKLARALPQAERFVFEAQMRRAALSIAANIAEGQQRHDLGDFLRHLSCARGSTGELRTHIAAVRRSGFDTRLAADAETMADSVARMLTSLAARLRQRWVGKRRTNRPPVHQP